MRLWLAVPPTAKLIVNSTNADFHSLGFLTSRLRDKGLGARSSFERGPPEV